MNINMNDNNLISVIQLKEFVKLNNSGVKFTSNNKIESYTWINNTLNKFCYRKESKKNKGIIKNFIRSSTGYSDTQVDRFIRQKKDRGGIYTKTRTQRDFPTIYSLADIELLSKLDNAEGRRNAKAVKNSCKEMYEIYKDERFKRLAYISTSHIYNLRKREVYKSSSITYSHTQSVNSSIGKRKKPEHGGKAGYIRVDSVHQGDQDKVKGVYHINLVDEVTQEEIVITVGGISEHFLLPGLEYAMTQFHVKLRNFHSDNGSEYINHPVSKLLKKLLIEQTKSRSLHTNDNALVEGKNAAVIRNQYGHAHIPQKYSEDINNYNKEYLNPYLFYHRQCLYSDEIVNSKGKIKKVYNHVSTPYNFLLNMPDVLLYLRDGVTVEMLRKESLLQTHMASAEAMRIAKNKLFAKIHADMIY